jgi:hypothetical protein
MMGELEERGGKREVGRGKRRYMGWGGNWGDEVIRVGKEREHV